MAAETITAWSDGETGRFETIIIGIRGNTGAQGEQGIPGDPGEVSNAELTAGLALGFVDVITIANVNLTTALAAGQTVDGETLVVGWKVLVAGQTSKADNGVYIVTAGAAVRDTLLDAWDEIAGKTFHVMRGEDLAHTNWFCTAEPGAGSLGTNDLNIESDDVHGFNVGTPKGTPWPIHKFPGARKEIAKGSNAATADFQPVFNAAIRSGDPVKLGPWEYPVRSYVKAAGEDGNDAQAILYARLGEAIDIEMSNQAKIVIPDTMLHSGGSPIQAVFLLARQFGGSTVTRTDTRTFRLRGGTIDASALTTTHGYGGGPAGGGLITLFNYRNPTIEHVLFDGGTRSHQASGDNAERFGAGFMDTAVSSTGGLGWRILHCGFLGFYDTALYFSGDSSGPEYTNGPDGEDAYVMMSWFNRCGMAATSKRDHRNFNFLYNKASECFLGAQHQSADAGPATKGNFTGNVFWRMGENALRVSGDDNFIAHNAVVDFGHWLDAPTTKIDDASAILLLTTTNNKVHHNTVRQETADWVAEAASSAPTVGLSIGANAVGADVSHNSFENVAQAIDDISTGDNHIDETSNTISGEVVPSSFQYHNTAINLGKGTAEVLNINPALQIWQDATTAADPATATMFGDAWEFARSGAGGSVVNLSREAHPLTEPLARISPYFTRITVATLGSLSLVSYDTKLPDLARFSGKPITVVAALKSSVIKTFGLRLAYDAGSGGSGAPAASTLFEKSIGTTWEYLRYTFTIPDLSAMTLGAGNFLKLGLRRDNSLAANDYDFGGMWVYFGNPIYTLQPLPMHEVLGRCQRYFWKGVVRSENGSRWISFPVTMHTTPTVTVSAGTDSDNKPDGFELAHTSAADITATANARL